MGAGVGVVRCNKWLLRTGWGGAGVIWGVLLGVVESTGLPESFSGVVEGISAGCLSLLIVLSPNELADLIEF